MDGKKICTSNATTTTKTIRTTSKSPMINSSTEHNPYENYTGEYGKEFHHYMQMGLNESNVKESVEKLIEYEIKKVNEELHGTYIAEPDGYIFVDVGGNEIEPLKHHPEYVTDHHNSHHHEENIAMIIIGCLIFGMCIFLIIMVYIVRKQNAPRERDVEEIDPKFDVKKTKMSPSKIVHEPLPSA